MRRKILNLLLLNLLCLPVTHLSAQEPLIVRPGIRLPMDSSYRTQLLVSLNHFLNLKDSANKNNSYVLPIELLATSALLDEFKNIESNAKESKTKQFSAYLENIAPLNDSLAIIQLSYLGNVKDTPVLRASFDLMAKRISGRFYFFSPLVIRTSVWKTSTTGNITFHYKNQLDNIKAISYSFYDSFYNAKLKIQIHHTEFYGADNFPDAMRILGISYKWDYNGISYNSFTSFENKDFLRVSGNLNNTFPDFDPHDMWHERLRMVVPADIIYRPVDEGCAYLYGGSWGLNWRQILTVFEDYAESHPGANWLELYEDGSRFSTGRYSNAIANVINALIVHKVEKEKGFDAVMTLLTCGARQKGDAKYFQVLQQVSGISQDGFNEAIKKLIAENK